MLHVEDFFGFKDDAQKKAFYGFATSEKIKMTTADSYNSIVDFSVDEDKKWIPELVKGVRPINGDNYETEPPRLYDPNGDNTVLEAVIIFNNIEKLYE